jgi:UDP-N-acetylglucosamine transferase subunit ALG13
MIFVTTGTCEPFDRLLSAVDAAALDEELVVQHGVSGVRPAGARCVDFLPFGELVELVRSARVVVTHAGVGSVLTTLMNGKRPIVVARLAEAGDAVDDHQLEFARRLAARGLVMLVEDISELPAAIREAAHDIGRVAPDPRLIAELRRNLRAAAA